MLPPLSTSRYARATLPLVESLISTDWLAAELGAPDLKLLDASSHLPAAGRDARADYAAAHIPGARFLDLEGLKDAGSAVPSALPTPGQFAARMRELGVSETDRIVLYDDSAVKTAARGWFMARKSGAHQVAILDGGLARWRDEHRPLESGAGAADQADVTPEPVSGQVRSKAEMLANLDSHAEQVVDARGPERFTGEDPEIRPGMPSGHIPGSRNLPFGQLFRNDGTFRPAPELRAAFRDAGIDLDRPVVTTCGSGVTASVLLFAMHLLGKNNIALYDGSWSEWGADPATPKATGAA